MNVVSLFTPAQTTAFFTQPAQMGLPARSYAFLLGEGFGTMESLFDMTDDTLSNVCQNARRPPALPDTNNANAQVPQAPFAFPANALQRLKIAHRCVKYYTLIGRTLTPDNMTWEVLQVFNQHWEIIDEQKDQDNSAGPKVGKDTQNLSYFEDHFQEWCDTNVGLQGAKYKYVIRSPPPMPLPLASNGLPYAEENSSVEEELATYCTHDHPRFKQDNQTVFATLEKALRNTCFYSTLRPFSRTKNGREAWIALKSQYLGEDKRRAEIREIEEILNHREWKGVSSYKLEKYASLHRWSNERLKQIAEHTHYQLPDVRLQVERFVTNIKSSDPELMAAVAQVKADKRLDGPLYDFEQCVAALLPSCPVAKRLKRNGSTKTQHVPAHIAAFAVEDNKETKGKKGGKYETGTTGVVFRHYDKDEYSQLSNEQKNELRLWRSSKNGDSKNKGATTNNKRGNDNNNTSIRPKKVTKNQMKTMVSEVLAQYNDNTSTTGDATVSSIASSSTSTNEAPSRDQIAGSLRRNLERRNASH